MFYVVYDALSVSLGWANNYGRNKRIKRHKSNVLYKCLFLDVLCRSSNVKYL